ncbi:MAG: ribosomal protein S18 acetylase RimI-like enzyme [Moritella dasanensis]|jgi:ribosomal protein S18 acetylase RimI-like enzyme
MLGAFDGSKLVGLCGVTPQSTDTADITQMYVESSYRGNSIGVNLLSLAQKYASTEFNVTTLKLDVYPDNQSAIRAYEKSGFKIEDSMAVRTENELCMMLEI